MSLEIIKNNLEQLINDKNNSVIALSGKWGTGKSHLWNEFKTAPTRDDSIKNSLYISLFGIKDVAQLKVKIFQGVQVTSTLIETLEKFNKGFGALNDIALLTVPSMLKNKFIVIDDIERKHEKFDVEEILGFIDEFTQNYNTRFLLILNNDQLADNGKWEKFREKVIDHELNLQITSDEAFDIAIKKTPSKYKDLIKKSVETCKVNNIRIIYKIIRTVNHLIQHRNDLTHEVLERLIPSTVLLSAVHFKGLEDGPTVEFILKYNTFDHAVLEVSKEKKEGVDEDKKNKLQWSTLLEKLHINYCDEYETSVIAYLETGLIDLNKVNAIIDQYVSKEDVLSAKKHLKEFFAKDLWHPEVTESELLDEAKKILEEVHLLSPYEVTILFDTVKDYPEGLEVAEQIITNWVDYFNKKDYSNFSEEDELDSFNRKLHPRIEEAFKDLRAKIYPPVSLFDVALKMASDNGFDDEERNAMKNSTPELFIETIESLNGKNLRIFLLKNIDLYIHKSTYSNHFGSGMDNFVKACKTIYNQDKTSRLGTIIKRVFTDSNIESELEIEE